MLQRKRWSDLSERTRQRIVLAAAIERILKVVALIDIERRPASEIRGSKAKWAVAVILVNSAERCRSSSWPVVGLDHWEAEKMIVHDHTPSLDPVPQELVAVVEARVRASRATHGREGTTLPRELHTGHSGQRNGFLAGGRCRGRCQGAAKERLPPLVPCGYRRATGSRR